MFPSDWAERKGTSCNSKRRKILQKEDSRALMEECESILSSDNSSALTDGRDDYDSIVNVIKRQVNDSKFLPQTPEEIQLDHVLSSLPYQALLESLFNGVNGSTVEVPLVSKMYEESYMREPFPGDKPCVMNERCECMFIDKNAPFIGTEFILPGEDTSKTLDTPRMCVTGASQDSNRPARFKSQNQQARIQIVLQDSSLRISSLRISSQIFDSSIL